MLTPTTGLPAFTISDLDPTQTPAITLAGALIETEILTGPGQYKNTKTTAEQLAEFLGTLLGTGGGANALELATNRHLFPDAVLPAVQAALSAGTLVWIIDTSSSQRTTIQASQFGVSPTNTAGGNADGVDKMRTYVLNLNS